MCWSLQSRVFDLRYINRLMTGKWWSCLKVSSSYLCVLSGCESLKTHKVLLFHSSLSSGLLSLTCMKEESTLRAPSRLTGVTAVLIVFPGVTTRWQSSDLSMKQTGAVSCSSVTTVAFIHTSTLRCDYLCYRLSGGTLRLPTLSMHFYKDGET